MKTKQQAEVAPASVGNNSEPCQSADAASESARAISKQASLHLAHPWQAHSAHEFAVSRHEVESGAAPTKEERERHLRLASEHRAAAEYWAKKESESRDIKAAPAECGQHTPTPWVGRTYPNARGQVVAIKIWAGNEFSGQMVCGMSPDSPDAVQGKTAFANAAFIVRACNAHDQLVSALQDVMRCFVGERNSSNCAGESGQVADRARAALAQAQKSA